MNRAQTKAQRLLQIEQLLWAHPEGLTRAEIARRLGVDRATITKYLDADQLPAGVYEDDLDGKKLKFDRSADLTKAAFNLHEVLALHLAARLLATRTDKQNPNAASALRKLAVALRRLDQNISKHLLAAADLMTEDAAYRDPVYLEVLQKLTEAWSAGRKVKVSHQMEGGRVFEYVFAPYFIEPYAVGQTAHVIGWREPPGALRTFKIERLRAVQILHEHYEIPTDFDPSALLRNAWGVWFSEAEPVEVVLRFHPRVASRVQESRWHRDQQVEAQPDGYLLWRARVAEVQEMLPWIRGWGADVEVLAPAELREEVVRHVSALAMHYSVGQSSTGIEPYRLLWAKADRKTGGIHRLVYHMIDVGLTAQLLWERCLHPQLKQDFADWLHVTVEQASRLVAFSAGLHDLGKGGPGFQDHPRMPQPLKNRIMPELRAAGFSFVENRPLRDQRTRHEVISTWCLRPVDGERLLSILGNLPSELASQLAQALGGHHGAWPRPDLFSLVQPNTADTGGLEWTDARAELVKVMMRVFLPPPITAFQPNSSHDNVMLTLFSAIVAAADWIGSQEEYFPLEEQHLPLDIYVRHARAHAQAALDHVNWELPASMPDFDFERNFNFAPNQFQSDAIAALAGLALPALVIIEGPMGLGKTELAFALYADWARRSKRAGLYIAMPTTATSNQMHERTTRFLSRQLGRQIEPLLVHSQALLRNPPEETDQFEEREGDIAAAQAWFLPRKKSLLAPYGVGTVDQALMSVLQTKHFFVRLLGLSHKVVIFDEVHAYDTYMSELFERLLTWLRAVGASVIVLSATLPENTRQRLVDAYTGRAKSGIPTTRYPRLTFAGADSPPDCIGLTPPPTKMLQYEWLLREQPGRSGPVAGKEDPVITKLRELLAGGGCAAVICNTVGRAQALFQSLRELPEKLCDYDNLILFHARFPMAWREEIEKKVLRKFGPGKEKGQRNPDRPPKAIVIATQVIEQSLDLDFDCMVSDLAPIDLLLQRSGRLQRHSANNPRQHPNCLWITTPPEQAGVPQFERSDKYVYDEYVLLRTWLALSTKDEQRMAIPDHIPDLIEDVYGDQMLKASDAMQAAMDKAKQQMDKDQFGERANARKRRVLKPGDEDLLWGDNLELEEDDPTVHATFQALTRSDQPGLSVVCLHRVNGQVFLDPTDVDSAYDTSQPPATQVIHNLARQALTIRHPEVEKWLLAEPADNQIRTILQHWRRISALRFHRVIIFENGTCYAGETGYALRLEKENQLGLQIS